MENLNCCDCGRHIENDFETVYCRTCYGNRLDHVEDLEEQIEELRKELANAETALEVAKKTLNGVVDRKGER